MGFEWQTNQINHLHERIATATNIPYTVCPTLQEGYMAKKEKEKNKDKKKKSETGFDFRDEAKRLNRINGQVDGIRKMLEDGRKLEEVLMQCKAVHSALRSIESRVLKVYLEAALDEVVNLDKKKNRAEKVAQLEELFKQAA